jgi:hypothetical protein
MSTPANTPSQTDAAAAAITAAADANPNGDAAALATDGEPKLTLANLFDEPTNIAPAPEPGDEPTPEPEPEPEPEVKDAPQPAPVKGARDLSKFDERDRPYLKEMSRPAFEHFSKRLDGMSTTISQRDELVKNLQTQLADVSDKKLPENWYEDPEAGRVSPEYREVEKSFHQTMEETHKLSDLLAQYEGGEIKWNAATNNFVPNDDQTPVNARVKQWLSDTRQGLYDKQKELSSKGNSLLADFGKHYKGDVEFTRNWVEKQFPWVKDEKHANQEVYKACIEQIKPSLRKSPLAPVVGTLGTAALMWANRAQVAEKKLAAMEANKNDRRRAGPTPNGRATISAVDQDEDKKFKKADEIFG